MIRRLTGDDREVVAAFLRPRFESSFILAANIQDGGFTYEGKRYQGVYAGAFENGELAGVVAHYWNGNIIFQAPRHAPELAQAVVEYSGIPLGGLVGPYDQLAAARAGLGAQHAPTRYDKREILYGLAIADMNLPAPLRSGAVTCRHSRETDVHEHVELSMRDNADGFGDPDTPEARERAFARVKATSEEGMLFALEAEGQIVAHAFFHGRVDGTVQLGGVFTLPQFRSRGYGRSVVAGALQLAQREGATRGLLFTAHDNIPAQRAYESLGFAPVGDYGVILFRDG